MGENPSAYAEGQFKANKLLQILEQLVNLSIVRHLPLIELISDAHEALALSSCSQGPHVLH